MIEIEIAFELTPGQEAVLLNGAEFISESQYHDEYFDTSDLILGRKDKWLRRRNGKYELKIPAAERTGPRAATTQYRELETDPDIAKELRLPTNGDLTQSLKQHQFETICDFTKMRRTYRRGEFTIVVDTFEFGTEKNAEIELLVADPSETAAAHQRIMDFLQSLGITIKPVIGQLLEYLKIFQSKKYQELVEAGVVY